MHRCLAPLPILRKYIISLGSTPSSAHLFFRAASAPSAAISRKCAFCESLHFLFLSAHRLHWVDCPTNTSDTRGLPSLPHAQINETLSVVRSNTLNFCTLHLVLGKYCSSLNVVSCIFCLYKWDFLAALGEYDVFGGGSEATI